MSPQVRFVELVKAILPGYLVELDSLDCLDCAMALSGTLIPEHGPLLRFASNFVFAFAQSRYDEATELVASHIRRWKNE